ncbi:MAG TPA: hypothetical protein VKR41_03940, partial [Puia sp.]|nr:hypothetical protein [Puia sp.]
KIGLHIPADYLQPLESGDMLWTIHLSQTDSLAGQVAKDAAGNLQIALIFNGATLPLTLQPDQDCVLTLTYGFNATAAATADPPLTLALDVISGANHSAAPLGKVQPPYPDWTRHYIDFSDDFNMSILGDGLDGKPPKGYFRSIETNDFISCRTEPSPIYVDKVMTPRVYSRYGDFYPDQPKKNCFDGPEFNLRILSNQPMPALRFRMTPLLMQEEWHQEGNPSWSRKRSMQILFEIDRPLANGEKFALVINGVADALGTPLPAAQQPSANYYCCALGRDTTTAGSAMTLAVPNAILTKKDDKENRFPYLHKYEIAAQPIVQRPSRTAAPQYFKLMPLEPFFDVVKNKWIVALGFKDWTAYNPFLKVVACRYQPFSETNYVVSAFTEPAFINLLSQRKVNITLEKKQVQITRGNGRIHTGQEQLVVIQVEGFNRVKTGPMPNPRSTFVVVLRHRTEDWIQGEEAVSRRFTLQGDVAMSTAADELRYHVMDTDTLYIQHQNNRLVCIYELEPFQNTPALDPKVDKNNWLDDPAFRLIYAESFDHVNNND